MSTVRRYFKTVLSAAAMFLACDSIGAVQAQTPIPSGTPGRSLQVTIDNVKISRKDLGILVYGLYEAANKKVDTLKKNQTQMPTASPYVYYAGRNPATGRGTVWEWIASPPGADANRMNDEYTAAYALAAIDLGFVGEPWKTLYQNAVKDDASRLALGEQISQAFDDASDLQKTAAETDVAWIRKNLPVGMPRTKVYAALRSFGLTAYNYAYAPGTPLHYGSLIGCTRDNEFNRLAAAWPYPGEPLPKRTGGCAIERMNKPEAFPTASMTLDGAFSVACGNRIDVTLAFGAGDLLKSVEISKPEPTCV